MKLLSINDLPTNSTSLWSLISRHLKARVYSTAFYLHIKFLFQSLCVCFADVMFAYKDISVNFLHQQKCSQGWRPPSHTRFLARGGGGGKGKIRSKKQIHTLPEGKGINKQREPCSKIFHFPGTPSSSQTAGVSVLLPKC